MKASCQSNSSIYNFSRSKTPLFASCQLSSKNLYEQFMVPSNAKHNINYEKLENFIHANKGLLGISFYGSSDNTAFIKKILNYCKHGNIHVFIDTDLSPEDIETWSHFIEDIDAIRIIINSRLSNIENVSIKDTLLEAGISTTEHDKLLAKIKILLFPLMDNTISFIKSYYQFCFDNSLKLNPIFIPFNAKGELTSEGYSDYVNTIRKINDYERIYLDLPNASIFLGKSSICPAMRYSIDLADNKLRTCKFALDFLGDINNWEKIWNSFNFSLSAQCQNCNFLKECNGGCLWCLEVQEISFAACMMNVGS